jgi:hypothetical protein
MRVVLADQFHTHTDRRSGESDATSGLVAGGQRPDNRQERIRSARVCTALALREGMRLRVRLSTLRLRQPGIALFAQRASVPLLGRLGIARVSIVGLCKSKIKRSASFDPRPGRGESRGK